MKIGIASDHRGYKLKLKLNKYLTKKGNAVIDYGTKSTISVDYPDFAFLLGAAVSNKEVDFGIALCGTGIGISISCNKVEGIRCALVNNVTEAKLAKEHNDANILALRGTMNGMTAKDIIDIFIKTNFSNKEKHLKRINKITEYEKNR